MTTLKEDSDSWKASGLKRRDFRHDASQPLNETTGPAKKIKKNTKKWCKGKVGVPHEYVREEKVYAWLRNYTIYSNTCKNCGKTYWGRSAKRGRIP